MDVAYAAGLAEAEAELDVVLTEHWVFGAQTQHKKATGRPVPEHKHSKKEKCPTATKTTFPALSKNKNSKRSQKLLTWIHSQDLLLLGQQKSDFGNVSLGPGSPHSTRWASRKTSCRHESFR